MTMIPEIHVVVYKFGYCQLAVLAGLVQKKNL